MKWTKIPNLPRSIYNGPVEIELPP